jgi:hypothetical protein
MFRIIFVEEKDGNENTLFTEIEGYQAASA